MQNVVFLSAEKCQAIEFIHILSTGKMFVINQLHHATTNSN